MRDPGIGEIEDPVDRLFAFVRERHRIWDRRQHNLAPPWTGDEILANYRFCCVYRELDRVTRWVRENWREPHHDHEDLWFAMCVARLFNREDTLSVIGWPIPWSLPRVGMALKYHAHGGARTFSAAYIVSTNGISRSKVEYVCRDVLDPMWQARERLRPRPGDTLQSYHVLLGQMQGFGSFMTAQVIADIKYHPPLRQAVDWWTFAASGPGSRRGLRRALGRPATREQGAEAWQEDTWRLELTRLRERLLPMFSRAKMPAPHAQDVQNMLCEFDKYERARLGEGKPKQRYRPQ